MTKAHKEEEEKNEPEGERVWVMGGKIQS